MVDMGIAWKLVVGLVLLLPMTAYVVGSLVVAAADEPREHAPIIIEEPTKIPAQPDQPSESPTDKPSDRKGDDHKGHHGPGGGGDDDEVITPSPSVFDDNDAFDDHGGNSGKGGGDDSGGGDSSGKGSGDD